jgi:hypothetical protein
LPRLEGVTPSTSCSSSAWPNELRPVDVRVLAGERAVVERLESRRYVHAVAVDACAVDCDVANVQADARARSSLPWEQRTASIADPNREQRA